MASMTGAEEKWQSSPIRWHLSDYSARRDARDQWELIKTFHCRSCPHSSLSLQYISPTQHRFVWLTKLSHENSCIEHWNSVWSLTELLAGTPGGHVISQGGLNTTRNAKKNQHLFKPGKWFNWSIHISSRYLTSPGSHTFKKRKLKKRFFRATQYFNIFQKPV